MIKTVVFDLDDTLYDEADYCRSGFKSVAHFLADTLGRGQSTEIYEALWDIFTSGKRGRVFNLALNQLGIAFDETLIRSLVRVYRGHQPNLRLPRDSRQVLDALRGDYQLGLLTDGYLPAQRLKFQALKLSKWFKTVIYTEQLGRQHWKPCPLGFERLMQASGGSGDQFVYVGDNGAKDFLGPNELGWHTIWVQREAGLHRDPPPHTDADPHWTLPALKDLPQFLEKLSPHTATRH